MLFVTFRPNHEPDIGFGGDVRVEKRAVVAGEGGATDVDVLIGDDQDLLVLSSLRVEEEKSSLTDEQQAAVVVEPDGPVAESPSTNRKSSTPDRRSRCLSALHSAGA